MPRMTNSKTQPVCLMPLISSRSLAMPQVRCAAASSKTRGVTLKIEYYCRRTFITRDQVYMGAQPELNTSTNDAAHAPALAVNPSSNTTYTKWPEQWTHKQNVNDSRVAPP